MGAEARRWLTTLVASGLPHPHSCILVKTAIHWNSLSGGFSREPAFGPRHGDRSFCSAQALQGKREKFGWAVALRKTCAVCAWNTRAIVFVLMRLRERKAGGAPAL